MLSKALSLYKRIRFVRSFIKKNRKVLRKIEEMASVFLNWANFTKHKFSTLEPPSDYALNLKALIKVSKVSWTSQLSYEILRPSITNGVHRNENFAPKTLKNSPHKLLIIPLDHQFSVQQVFSLWNWDSFKVWNFLIFEVVKLCRMKQYLKFS